MSALFPSFKKQLLDGDNPLDSGDIRALLVDGYTYTSTHNFLDDVTAGLRAGSAVALASKTTTDGVFDAADTTIPAVAAGKSVDGIILYLHTGTESTSSLIAYINGFTEVPTNGGDITIQWDSGANRIFAL